MAHDAERMPAGDWSWRLAMAASPSLQDSPCGRLIQWVIAEAAGLTPLTDPQGTADALDGWQVPGPRRLATILFDASRNTHGGGVLRAASQVIREELARADRDAVVLPDRQWAEKMLTIIGPSARDEEVGMMEQHRALVTLAVEIEVEVAFPDDERYHEPQAESYWWERAVEAAAAQVSITGGLVEYGDAEVEPLSGPRLDR